MHRLATATALAAFVLVTKSAPAQVGTSFAEAGTVVVGAERLTGIFAIDTKLETSGAQTIMGNSVDIDSETNGNATVFAFLGNDEAGTSASIPRLSLDVFPIDSFSVGGSLMYVSRSGDDERTGSVSDNGQTADLSRVENDNKGSTFTVMPRVGFARMFTDHVGLWGRAGVTYLSTNTETESVTTPDMGPVTRTDTETTISAWLVSLDAMLVLSPINHFGFALGPYLDIPITGSVDFEDKEENSTLEADLTLWSYGAFASLLGWF